LAKQDKPIVIDFTLIEPSAPPTPPATVPQKKAERPIIAKTIPQPTPPKQKNSPPAPASEPDGPVPVLMKRKEALPAPPEQSTATATNAVPGGTGTAGTSRTAGVSPDGTAEQLSNKYRAENFAYIKKIIEQNLSYPRRAQRMSWMGNCVVSFVVQVSGHVTDIRIRKSTGYDILDDNVIETIKKTEPFPRPPVKAELKIPITYRIE
jgi:protein TonB